MAYRVHATVESMKMPPFHAALHGPMGVAESPQLPNRNDAMLPPGQRRPFVPSP